MYRLRMQLSIVTSALILIVGCNRPNHNAGPIRIARTGRSSVYLPLFVAGPPDASTGKGSAWNW
jgi:hypothetical protein